MVEKIKMAFKIIKNAGADTDNLFIFEIGEGVFIGKYDRMFIMVDTERERFAYTKVDQCNYALIKADDDKKIVEFYNHDGLVKSFSF